MENYIEYIVPLFVTIGMVSGIITLGFIINKYFKYKHQERIALIEKGLDLPVSEFKLNQHLSLRVLLKTGILLSGTGIGILGGFILQNIIPGFTPPLPYLFSIPFFSGLSLIVFFYISKAE